ncbi:MAG: Ppx/GppA family phosphatase [Rhodobacteraceae bacterium]|nr:Ppx/GppA family phosphatase [Paracoccaceae bacterium]
MNANPGAHGDDWSPFGRPLFDDPSARALERVGVVDVGSNSVRMVVFDGAARSPAYFYNEKVLAGLGQGLAQTGRLNPQGRVRALAALKRFALIAEGLRLPSLTCVATAAVREAEDGPEFHAEIERETGLKLWVIDGQEEARLSAQGVLLGWPEAEGLVCDIGGNSMELAEVSGGRVGRRVTSPLGPFRLQQVTGGRKGLADHIRTEVERLAEAVGRGHERIYLVGGSWRAFARLDMERRNYPLTVLHEYRMGPQSVLQTANWIAENDINALRARTGTSAARMELVPIAAQVLRQMVLSFHPREIDVSSYGIREGLLYEQMPDRLKMRDPLIEACRYAERTMARMPGFGKRLYAFIFPLFRNLSEEKLRLVKAACLLHDTTWRAHPDYRAEVCFDNATRANLGGLSHAERVFLGVALLHRYKNSRAGSRFEPLFSLLDEHQLREAEVLGKAMRFGAMFSVKAPDEAGEMIWRPKKKILELKLKAASQPLFGEVAEARFTSLVAALGAEAKVTVTVAG